MWDHGALDLFVCLMCRSVFVCHDWLLIAGGWVSTFVQGVDVEVSDLCDGKIFVTCATSSPFNLVIPGIGGLVCDGGSLLAHPAITAREHGKPCVVGVGVSV